MKIYFCYICHIYLICFIIYLLYIYNNGGHVLQRKLKKTILNKYYLKWKETSEKCKWEQRTR